MVASLGVVALALRAGLRLRRARFGREPRTPDLLRAHLRVAKPAIAVTCVGFLAGPISAAWLRDWTPFATIHAWLGVVAVGLFLVVAVLGWRLERRRGRPVDAHAMLAGLAVLAAAVAVVAGLVLLP
jgi:peptidoglycan/LPS O-acetylase OafA/YrhL